MRPNEINETNEKYVFQNIYGFKNFKDMFFKNTIKNNYLNTGDNVRLKYDLSKLDKSYYPLWSDNIYNVSKIFNKYNKPLYSLNEGSPRRYYKEELQKVNVTKDTTYRIEKVLKKRVKNNITEVYVKWLNYPSNHNSWIPETEVVKLK
jgi:hypothetical protein